MSDANSGAPQPAHTYMPVVLVVEQRAGEGPLGALVAAAPRTARGRARPATRPRTSRPSRPWPSGYGRRTGGRVRQPVRCWCAPAPARRAGPPAGEAADRTIRSSWRRSSRSTPGVRHRPDGAEGPEELTGCDPCPETVRSARVTSGGARRERRVTSGEPLLSRPRTATPLASGRSLRPMPDATRRSRPSAS